MNNNVAILVNSCDKYEDAWVPFFKLLKIQWPEACRYKIYLNTENKIFNCDFLSVSTLRTGEAQTWTERLELAVKSIDEEFILFFLEDFFLLDKVDNLAWNSVLDSMQRNEKIGYVWFPAISIGQEQFGAKRLGEYLCETKKTYSNRVNATCALWRKEFFLQMMYLHTNPWDFEKEAPIISLLSSFDVSYTDPFKAKVFPYDYNVNNGICIAGGKWLIGNKELFEKNDIAVDFNKLGVWESNTVFNEIIYANKGFYRFFNRGNKKLRHSKICKYCLYFIQLVKFFPGFKIHCIKTKKYLASQTKN